MVTSSKLSKKWQRGGRLTEGWYLDSTRPVFSRDQEEPIISDRCIPPSDFQEMFHCTLGTIQQGHTIGGPLVHGRTGVYHKHNEHFLC
jgi:hypothetical protein